MAMTWAVKILDWIGKPTPFIASAALLFCGVSLWCLQYPWFAKAKQVMDPYQGWLQLGVVASSVYLTVFGALKLWSVVNRAFQRRRLKHSRLQQLHSLTIQEQQVLGAYIRRQSRTVGWPLDFGVI